MKLEIGTRIFNRGDMANPEHFGTVTAIKYSRWGVDYLIRPDDESDRCEYYVPAAMVSEKDLGHGGTRIITEEAYNTFRAERIAEMQKRMRK